ncbi:GxxExxY protein [Candidatus Uhrbacteria bacterium]|nr:GxxExxY protein [Candidatus Uhrbacteria bacterium]
MPTYRTQRTTRLVLPELSYQVTGVLFEVHNALGRFASERQYASAIASTLTSANLAFQREVEVRLESPLGSFRGNRVDFVICGVLVLELKAKTALEPKDYAQTKRYITALKCPLGILVNFRARLLQPRRILNPQFVDSNALVDS